MKVALYARTSTSDQKTENQIIKLREHAKNNSWEFDIYEEVESSRKTRPVKANLLAKLRDKNYDAVIVWKLCRWARSTTELILELNELNKKGIRFISLTDNIDFNSAAGKLHLQILAAFNEFERELIRERTILGLQRVRQSKRLGRPPGSKDSKPRKKSGYILKEAKKKQDNDEKKGMYKPIENYLNR